MIKILIVEDDQHLGSLLKECLGDDYNVHWVARLSEAQDWLAHQIPQLILLDLNLPDGNGLELIESVRLYSSVPFLILSAQNETATKVKGLNLGADDYLTKPFSVQELHARVKSLLRRTTSGTGISLGNTYLNVSSQILKVDDQNITLTEHETKILETMMRTPERVLTRSDIESRIYGLNTPYSNSIEVRISQLRKKLKESGSTIKIVTLRNVGYTVQVEKSSIEGK